MNNPVILFCVAFILGGITTLLSLARHKEVKRIMSREDNNYTGQVNNTIDAYRIMKTYVRSKTLSKKERDFLGVTLILIGINILVLILFVWFFILFSKD